MAVIGHKGTFPVKKTDFLKVMNFPEEWLSSGMYPDELFHGQLAIYKPGDEQGSEHDRNGAFHWWLRRNPSKAQLSNLLRLAALDSETLMALDVLSYIEKSAAFDEELATKARALFPRR